MKKLKEVNLEEELDKMNKLQKITNKLKITRITLNENAGKLIEENRNKVNEIINFINKKKK